ncbi:hypothetical protein SPONL_890 [uncultured Candidatus Thioglobus sp.]|nr:hypothetical protein SPONL_890 [uncultured Candidatus Thioglobus sp.]
MIKILIISLFLFTQQAFSTVISEADLTGAYANSGPAIEYINNEVEEPIETVNFILCFLKSLRSEAFLTQGDYQVWTQFGFCDQEAESNTPYAKVVVNATREDENSPQIVNATFRVESNGVHSTSIIKLTARITAAPTVANPLGELTLYWTQVFPDASTTEDDGKGALRISNGRVESVIYDASNVLDEYISGDVANKQGSLYEVDDNNVSTKKTFKFNDGYINTVASNNSNTCYDRSLKTKTVWEYDIYAYDPSNTAASTVKFVPSTDGIKSFPFSYINNGDNKFGYASYDYVYLDNSSDNPTTITNLNTGDEYTVVYNSSSNRFTSIDNGSITIAPPVSFTIPSFLAIDIRSGANPPTSYVVNSDDISIYDNNSERLSLKDGVLLLDSNNKQYVVKANFLETTFNTTNSDACDGDGLRPTNTYAEPTIAVGDIVIDVNGLSSIDNIDTVSVINGVIQ